MHRRYAHGGELLSQNCGVDPFAMSPQKHIYAPRPSQDEAAYAGLTKFCHSIGATPMTFDDWIIWDQALNPVDAEVRERYHNPDREVVDLVEGADDEVDEDEDEDE